MNLSAVAEADGAVGMRVGQQSLAKVVNPLVKLIWNVGRLKKNTHTHRFMSTRKKNILKELVLSQ